MGTKPKSAAKRSLDHEEIITKGQVYAAYLLAADNAEKREAAKELERAYQQQLDRTISALAEMVSLPVPMDSSVDNPIHAYRELLAAVAFEFVPGLKRKKSGRPPKWDGHMKWLLVADMDRLVKASNTSANINSASIALAAKWYWKDFVEEKDGTLGSNAADALRAAYNSACKAGRDPSPFDELWHSMPAEAWEEYVERQVAERLLERRYGGPWAWRNVAAEVIAKRM